MTRCILVVDDEPAIREIAHTSLELIGGYEVLSAGSGGEGVEVALRNQPDAILLDAMMPNMDGAATIAALKSHESTARIPIVMLTAKVRTHERAAFEQLGVAGLIAKPFDAVELPAELARVLGWT